MIALTETQAAGNIFQKIGELSTEDLSKLVTVTSKDIACKGEMSGLSQKII